MVSVGFICEGKTEFLIVTSDNFKRVLNLFNLLFVDAIDATGNRNLLPDNIKVDCDKLTSQGASAIFIISDLDLDACVTKTKSRIGSCGNSISVISKKEIESWFLADSQTLSSLMKKNYFFEFPETEGTPFETLKKEFIAKTGKGIGYSKVRFARKMIDSGFNILNAANHPNCSSAKYFVKKLKSISN